MWIEYIGYHSTQRLHNGKIIFTVEKGVFSFNIGANAVVVKLHKNQ